MWMENSIRICSFNPQGTDWVSVTQVNFENSAISKEVDGGGPYRGRGGFEVPNITASVGSVSQLVFKLYALEDWSRVFYTQSVRNVAKSVFFKNKKLCYFKHEVQWNILVCITTPFSIYFDNILLNITMFRTIPAQLVRKCMSFSSGATLRKRRRIIYSNIHFLYLLLQSFSRKWQRVEKLEALQVLKSYIERTRMPV